MAVTLGARPQADFDQPLGLLSDCHRRIEHFLGVLRRVLKLNPGHELTEEHRRAIQTCLHYFNHAAPKHTADEEESLFPRLRELAESNPRVCEVMARIDALEADHHAADDALAEIREWFERWMDVGTLAPVQVRRLDNLLQMLEALYARHIDVEDNQVFRLAGEVLGEAELEKIGREMALRRGVESVKVRAVPFME